MGFENLDVWKRSCRLSCDIYKAMENCCDYGFKDQITRSDLSIPSNIAEGLNEALLRRNSNFITMREAMPVS